MIDISIFHYSILQFISGINTLEDIDTLIDILTRIEAPLVDIYTVCRMFKTFKTHVIYQLNQDISFFTVVSIIQIL
jgi:hypothetical protein